ncbi:MAG: DUF2158 domain-containing protein [Pseudomonadota bacterium]
MQFHIGDVVVLNSGGPKMTVSAVKADRVFCVWFNRRDDYHEERTGEFLVATLKALQPTRRVPKPETAPLASTETASPAE